MTHQPYQKRHQAYRLGLEAERDAAQLLEAKGMTILAERWRTPHGEIDVLAVDGDTLVIAEVKARGTLFDALESITRSKRTRLANAALYALANPHEIAGLEQLTNPNIRFDVVVVTPNQSPEHLPHAWNVDD